MTKHIQRKIKFTTSFLDVPEKPDAYSMRLLAAKWPASRTGIAQKVLNVGRVKPAKSADKPRGFHPPYKAARLG